MSRYMLAPHSRRHEVCIGWDRPLANFFLQVRDLDVHEDEADLVIVWLGADDYATETEVDHVLEEASRWALVPQVLRAQLLLDQQYEGARPGIIVR